MSRIQQKLDSLCEELSNVKDYSGAGDIEVFGSDKNKLVSCGCSLCDQHHTLFNKLVVRETIHSIATSLGLFWNFKLWFFLYDLGTNRPILSVKAKVEMRISSIRCLTLMLLSKRSAECLIYQTELAASHLLLKPRWGFFLWF